MATVKILITDAPDEGVTVTVESKNPPLPLDDDGTPLPDRLTGAQAVALSALMAVSEQSGELLVG